VSLKDASVYFLLTAKYLLLIRSLLAFNTKAQIHRSTCGGA